MEDRDKQRVYHKDYFKTSHRQLLYDTKFHDPKTTTTTTKF